MKNIGIKLFADGADLKDMFKWYNSGIISGFTTNPTLMKKAGITNYEEFAKVVLKAIPDMPISFEVFSDDPDSMEKEARKIASWGENVYVKIPITHTNGISTSTLINKLSVDGIKLNITAILTLGQVQIALMALSKETPSIISVFAGRIADTGKNPVDIMSISSALIKRNKNTELLWASTREVYNVIQAKNCGCDIITVTPDILKKLSMLGKDLKELSLETVQMFYNDAKEAGYKI
jgi:transaldolase